MDIKGAWLLAKDAAKDWNKDNASLYSAALAYYTLFSMAPLLLITVAIAGLVFGERAAQGQLVSQLQVLVGSQSAEIIQRVMASMNKPQQNVLAAIIGTATLLVGASGVFIQLQTALNSLWRITLKPQAGWRVLLRTRLLSFSIVAGSGFLLLVSLIISAVLSALDSWLDRYIPGASLISQVTNMLIGLAVTGTVFAAIFKVLPDASMRWRDVWTGGLVTAVLFNIGRFFIGLYLGKSSVASGYGAAASIILLLLWVYYSAMILFYGSEFTKLYAQRYGSKIVPATHAELRP
jgi:membrane protein